MKRKRSAQEQAVVDANAAKRVAISAEVALGPLPVRWAPYGTFLPWLMPEGLFDSEEPDERWAAHPDYAPSEVLVSNYGRVATRSQHAPVGEYDVFTFGSLDEKGYRRVNIDGNKSRVHVLVCEAFHGPKPDIVGITVDHIEKYDAQPNPPVGRRPSTLSQAHAGMEGRRVNRDGLALRRWSPGGARAQRAARHDQVYTGWHFRRRE